VKNKPSEKKLSEICRTCGARCCRYIATEIDTPTCKRDYDHIRWYLLHETVHVFMDHDNDWYLEVESPCEYLGPDGRCMNYEHRPRICRKYGADDLNCEFLSEDEPHVIRFSTATEYEDWLDDNKVKWRWKKR
jgi:Fe-S-cluster containining protein